MLEEDELTERNPALVLLLTLVTCTVYGYYWLYVTTDELRRETGRDEPSPLLDLVLAVVTAGLWGLYASWRNARIVHEELEARGEPHTDSTAAVLIFNLSTFIWGGGWLVSLVLLQLDYNRLSRTTARTPMGLMPVTAF